MKRTILSRQKSKKIVSATGLSLPYWRREWGKGTAALLERAWGSDSLSDCPTFGDWLARLPHEVPEFTPRLLSTGVGTAPVKVEAPEDNTEAGPGAAIDPNLGPTHAARSMMAAARQFEEKGDLASARTSYHLALSLAPAGGALARELSIIVAELESGEKPKSEGKRVVPLISAVKTDAQGPEPAPVSPSSSASNAEDEINSLFYGGLAASKGKRWAEARELLSEVVRRQPDYEHNGLQARKMLDEAEAHVGAGQLVGRAHVDTLVLPIATSPTPVAPKTVLSYEATEIPVTQPVTVKAARAPRQLRFIAPIIAGVLLVVFGAIAIIMVQGGNKGQTLAVVPTVPKVTDTAVVAKVDVNATQLAASTATSIAQAEATSTEVVVLAMKTTEATGFVQATQEASTAEAQALIVQAAATTDAQLQAQVTATALELQAQAQQAQSEATSQVLQAQATANAAMIVEQQATARALGGLQAQATALVLNATVTAQAEEIATSKALGRANGQATTQAQNIAKQATAQAQSQATNQAKSQSLAIATTHAQQTVQAQQTAQAQQAVQATAQAVSQLATIQAQQAAAQQATTQAKQAQAAQVATSQAEAAVAATVAAAQAAQAAQATLVANETSTSVALALSTPRTLVGHTEGVTSVVFSPDGETLASASLDHTIKLWRVSDGSNIRTLSGHTEWVENIAFSPDGQMLASSSYDKTIRLWKVSDGSAIRTLTGHDATVNSVAFSPDGQTLVSGSDDKTVKLWRVSDRICYTHSHRAYCPDT